MHLPPVLGKATRDPVVLLVTGRTAVARMGGMTAVARHVATVDRLGLEPVVLFPREMKALGAEIAGQVGERTLCLAADSFGAEAGPDEGLVLVIAGDWYVSPRAIIEFSSATPGRAAARFNDRGRKVAPMARMTVSELRSIIPVLATRPSGELILEAAGERAPGFELPASERHRLSDNVAIERAENKLFAGLQLAAAPWPLGPPQRRLVRRLAGSVAPLLLALAKLALGLVAAWTLSALSYGAAVTGALVYLAARLLDELPGELARARVDDSTRVEKFELAGDTVTGLALVAALAGSSELGPLLAVVTGLGLLAGAYMAGARMLAPLWAARRRGRLYHLAPADFEPRLASRDGAAYALLVAALLGRTDLFLWAAALASHLVYILWMVRAEKENG